MTNSEKPKLGKVIEFILNYNRKPTRLPDQPGKLIPFPHRTGSKYNDPNLAAISIMSDKLVDITHKIERSVDVLVDIDKRLREVERKIEYNTFALTELGKILKGRGIIK